MIFKMKNKFIYLLLLMVLGAQAQTIPSYKNIKLTATAENPSATKIGTIEADKTFGYIQKSDLLDVIEVASAINLPSPGVAGKIYVTKDNNKIYRWNGTFYDQLAVTDISGKVDKVAGKGLSTEDYTTTEKTKLAGIQAGATANSTDAQLRDRATHTGTQAISTVMGLQAAIDAKINLTLIGANNGITPLDPGGKVPFAYLPASLMIYKGMWNPATNTPTLSDGTGVAGWVYKANASGTVDLGSGNLVIVANDFIIHNGTKWEWSSGTDDVVSVNGQQGVVSINTSHIPEVTNKRYQTDAQQANNNATSPIQQQLDGKAPSSGSTSYIQNQANSSQSANMWISGVGVFGSDIAAVNGGFSGTVSALGGNSTNWNTAYSWGNHNTAGYAFANGSNATGTWGINISGNASNSTLWNSEKFVNIDKFDAPFYLIGYDSASSGWKPTRPEGIKLMLGLGTNAYSSTAYAPINGFGANGSSPDSYGAFSVTNANDKSYAYYGMTRAGILGVGIGITTGSRIWFGNSAGGGEASTLSGTPWFDFNNSSANFIGSVTATSFNGSLNGNANSATNWGGFPADFSVGISTPAPQYITGFRDAVAHNYTDVAIKAFLGLGTNAYSSTPYLPLTGNAVSATELHTITYDGTNLNTAGLGKHVNYSNIWSNFTGAPSTAGYGTAYNLGGGNASSLSLQLLADVNHNSTSSTKDFYFRTGNNLGFQNDWKKLWHDGNFNPANYLPLSGGTLSGNLVISTNVPELTLEGTQISGKKYGLISGITGVSNTGFSIRNQTDGINLLSIDNSSNASFYSSVTASGFFQSSDRRLKYIHKRDGDVAYYTWKDGRDDKMHIGWIAQEVRKQFPDQVQKNEDGYLSVSYIEILVAKNRDLEKKLEALEGRIKQLEKSK